LNGKVKKEVSEVCSSRSFLLLIDYGALSYQAVACPPPP